MPYPKCHRKNDGIQINKLHHEHGQVIYSMNFSNLLHFTWPSNPTHNWQLQLWHLLHTVFCCKIAITIRYTRRSLEPLFGEETKSHSSFRAFVIRLCQNRSLHITLINVPCRTVSQPMVQPPKIARTSRLSYTRTGPPSPSQYHRLFASSKKISAVIGLGL